MRFARTHVAILLSLVLAFPLLAQQTASSATQTSPQALTLLQNSLVALTGGQSIKDITLSGSARRIAGSDDETGTATLKALPTGEARVDLSLASGTRSDVVGFSNTKKCQVGSWSGPDGVAHPIANHNLMSDSSWFFPLFTLTRIVSSGRYVAFYVGHETRNGQSIEHLTAYQNSPFQLLTGVPSLSHLTQMDVFLDSTSLLPVSLVFNTHPDNDMGLDIPIEITFSDYRPVNGAQIPFHIQKSLNNSLLLDFQAQTVTPNSGLSATDFTVEAGL